MEVKNKYIHTFDRKMLSIFSTNVYRIILWSFIVLKMLYYYDPFWLVVAGCIVDVILSEDGAEHLEEGRAWSWPTDRLYSQTSGGYSCFIHC